MNRSFPPLTRLIYLVSGLFSRLFLLLLSTFLWGTLWAHPVYAGTIAVNGTTCTLPEAIAVANSDGNADGCTITGKVGGADTLNLAAITHAFDSGPFYYEGETATPSITTVITIEGNDAIIERRGVNFARFFHVDSTGDLTLRNVTMRYGMLNRGGAIYNVGKLTIVGSTIVSNNAIEYGGAIYNLGQLTIVGSEIASNEGGSGGGGIYNLSGTLTISDSTISSNKAWEAGGIGNFVRSNATLTEVVFDKNISLTSGGAFYNRDYSVASFTSAHFVLNEAGSFGGGITNEHNSTVNASDFELRENSAAYGAGISNQNAATVILNSAFITYNLATGAGGGVYNVDFSTANMNASQIINNVAVNSNGGGLFTDSRSKVNIAGSEFRANQAAEGGGIFSNNDSKVVLDDTKFIANSASGFGGGAAIYSGRATFGSVIFNDNHSSGGGGAGGLGVSGNCIATLTDVQFIANVADGNGGGFVNENNSTSSLDDVEFRGNSALDGAGIANLGGILTLKKSVISSNTAERYGGGILNNLWGDVTISDSDIVANVAEKGAGIFLLQGSTLTISSSKIASNIAEFDGGGVYVWPAGPLMSGSAANITDSDIVSNTATIGNGGGMWASGEIRLSKIRLATNVAAKDGGGIYGTEVNLTLSQSCVEGNSNTAVITGYGITASNNWWGTASGPGGEGPGTGDSIGGGVTFDPFVTSPLPCAAAPEPVTPEPVTPAPVPHDSLYMPNLQK